MGLDGAQAMLDSARKAHPGVDFLRGDASALPFPAAVLDVAVANFAIMHLSEPEHGVSELARVLMPDGKVVRTVWDVPARRPALRMGQRSDGSGWRRASRYPSTRRHQRTPTNHRFLLGGRGGICQSVLLEANTGSQAVRQLLPESILEGPVIFLPRH